MKLNLGSGKFLIPDFVNLDKLNLPEVDLKADFKKLPFKDNYIEEIYAGHTLQCVRQNEIDSTLKEWHRVLQPGGKLTVVVPNAEFLSRSFISGDIPLNLFAELVFRGLDNLDGKWQYQSFFDDDNLAKALMRAGFREVKQVDLSQCPYVTTQVSWQFGMEGLKP